MCLRKKQNNCQYQKAADKIFKKVISLAQNSLRLWSMLLPWMPRMAIPCGPIFKKMENVSVAFEVYQMGIQHPSATNLCNAMWYFLWQEVT